ncbi:hypothetical protein [Candidatus Avelusimicrobium sp.]|uniref:hypothetical protein n=1 Tax=Candidatus Avelusimicrobium sp. TaxID=3048833 RepID=UPI003F818382
MLPSLFIRVKTGNFAHFGIVLRILEIYPNKMPRRRNLDKNTPNSLKWITGKKQAKAGKKLIKEKEFSL